MADGPADITAALGRHYRLIRVIGQGGMATVHLADDLRRGGQVAIKVLKPEIASAVGSQRFTREIAIASRLRHPGIVPLLDSGVEGGHHYYVMPYLASGTLRQLLQSEPQLPVSRALRILRQVADALDAAHREGLVHRDLKPENIVLSGDVVQVADFGIARDLGETSPAAMTATGVFLGTPCYMSPEQIAGSRGVDRRSDVYALGCLAYEVLGGQPPFIGPTPQVLLRLHLTQPAPDVTLLRPGLPAGVTRAVQRALSKSAADRFGSAGEFVSELEREALAGPVESAPTLPLGAPGPTPETWRRRARGRVPAIVALGILLAVVVAGGLWWGRRRAEPAAADAATVAVFPFDVHEGAETGYLRDGLPGLMAMGLDGVGTRVVDTRLLSTYVREHRMDLRDPKRAGETALRFGARRFILGDAYAVGGEVVLQAALYEAGRIDSPDVTASARGPVERLPELVDQLNLKVMPHLGAGDVRPSQLRLMSTPSLPALRAFLAGDEAARQDNPGLAIASYERAIAADSAFALAWYRLGRMHRALGDYTAARSANEHAEQWSARLPRREGMFLRAEAAFIGGRADEAEAIDREASQLYPDDAEVWARLGQNLFIYNSLRGRPLAEAREPLLRAARLEGPDGESMSLLARLATVTRDCGLLDSLVEVVQRAEPGQPHEYFQAQRWLVCGRVQDSAAVAGVERSAGYSMGDIAMWCWRFDAVRDEKLVRYPAQRHLLLLAQGRVRRASEVLAERARRSPAATLPYQALFALLPFPPASPDTLAALRGRVLAWQARPAIAAADRDLEEFEQSEGRRELIAPYLLGLIEAHLGMSRAAESRVGALQRLAGDRYERQWADFYAHSVRSTIALARGDSAGALAELERAPLVTQPGGRWTFRSMSRERYLRSELLLRAGRIEDALRWSSTCGEVLANDFAYFGPWVRVRCAALERMGRSQEAAEIMDRAREQWRQCDPGLEALLASPEQSPVAR